MKTQNFPARDAIRLEAVLYALSDPVRLAIVLCMAQSSGERPCGAFEPALPKSTLAHHFKVLRASGLLATRAEGTQSLNSLRRGDLDARFPGLLDAVLRAAASSACGGNTGGRAGVPQTDEELAAMNRAGAGTRPDAPPPNALRKKANLL